MGNDCTCNKTALEQEQILLIDKTSAFKGERNDNLDRVKSENKFYTVKEIINQNPENYAKLIHIKAVIMAYKERKVYKAILKKYRESQHYFTSEELFETLAKKPLRDLKIYNATYTYRSNAIYTGEWFGGFRHGQGKMKWEDCVAYEGKWAFGFAEGEGLLTYPNGDFMKGNFVYNRLNGIGQIHNSDTGYDYYGEWENDLQSGEGKETWPDGSSYEGIYEMGKKEGMGKYVWTDGTFYIGEWKDNKIHGLGIYNWSDGRKYAGEWKNSKMNGHGIFFWSDGRKYIGEYHEDKKSRFGIFSDLQNKKYEGFWENGVKYGFGKYTKSDNSFKLGYWENNQMKEVIQDETEIGNELAKIDNYLFETNKKVEIVLESLKILFSKYLPKFSLESLGIN